MIEVRVPASSANIGSGFDCFGIALSLYNTIHVSEIEDGLQIFNENSKEYVPRGTNNIIYRSIIRVFDEVGYKPKGIRIKQNSEIPMTRGLGSSSACIVGGLLAANAITKRQLDMQRIFELADELEGHPDNVAAALFGGFTISCREGEKLFKQTIRIKNDIEFVAMVPQYYVTTKNSRKLLPDNVSLNDASYNISHASNFVAAMAMGDYKNLGVFCNDRIHQSYRTKYVEDMDKIFDYSKENGAIATYLSGSGPTVVSIIEKGNETFLDKMNSYFENEKISRECISLQVDNVGAILKEY